jgi:hypothetical protein
VSCTDDLLAVGFTVRARWLASQQATACWRYERQAASATRGPGAPQAPRIAREALDAVARSWHLSTGLPTENPEGPFEKAAYAKMTAPANAMYIHVPPPCSRKRLWLANSQLCCKRAERFAFL